MTQKKVELLSEAIPSISRSINQASDSLNKNIAAFEEALNEFRIGVSVEIVLNQDTVPSDGEPLTFIESLEYAKHKSRWGLWLVEYYEESVDTNDQNTYNVTPLKDAPRELRFQAVDKLPELLQRIIEKGKKYAEEAAERSESVARLTSNLKTINLLNI